MHLASDFSQNPFEPAPWWVLDLLEELRAARVERQQRAYVAAGYKPFDLSPWTSPECLAACRASVARLMAGVKLNPAPLGFD